MKQYTYEELDKALLALDQVCQEDGDSQSKYLVSEMTDKYKTFLETKGFLVTPTGVTIRDDETLVAVQAVCDDIMSLYDGEKSEEPRPDEYDLGGDDSYDYHASYIETILMAVTHIESEAV